jgi:hypothetical protein
MVELYLHSAIRLNYLSTIILAFEVVYINTERDVGLGVRRKFLERLLLTGSSRVYAVSPWQRCSNALINATTTLPFQ